MARTLMMLCFLVAPLGRTDEGGDWRDRVTLLPTDPDPSRAPSIGGVVAGSCCREAA